MLRTDLDKVKAILKAFSDKTNLMFEEVMYSAQYYRDCNNYTWIPENTAKSAKLKGCFEVLREPHKNHSSLVVPKALEAFYVHGIPIEETIAKNKDIYDYCRMVKVKNCKFEAERFEKDLSTVVEKQGKIVRYYMVKDRGYYNNVRLKKIMPPLKKETQTDAHKKKSPTQTDIFGNNNIADCIVRKNRVTHLHSDYHVNIFNKYEEKEFDDYNIDLNYYIEECHKVINAVNR